MKLGENIKDIEKSRRGGNTHTHTHTHTRNTGSKENKMQKYKGL
jgi:hypothetical protein